MKPLITTLSFFPYQHQPSRCCNGNKQKQPSSYRVPCGLTQLPPQISDQPQVTKRLTTRLCLVVHNQALRCCSDCSLQSTDPHLTSENGPPVMEDFPLRRPVTLLYPTAVVIHVPVLHIFFTYILGPSQL